MGFNREIHNLFVIATEGTETEVYYFEELKASELADRGTMYLEVIKRKSTESSNSSPSNVLRQLDTFKKEYNLQDGDELWVVIDRDKQS